MSYNIFIDDERNPKMVFDLEAEDNCGCNYGQTFVVCRSTNEAMKVVSARGMPTFMALDHDLGGNDTAMNFLKWLANEYWDGSSPIPDYSVHSSNPAGRANIISFMETWWKVANNFQPRAIMPTE